MKDAFLPLILGMGSLLALQLVVVKGRARGRLTVALYLVGLLVAIPLVGMWLGPPRFLPDAASSSLTVRVANDLKAALSASTQPEIVLIEGGSHTARGIDGKKLQARLSKRLGRDVKVVFLALPGGNQSERRVLLHDALALLNSHERAWLRNAKVLLMLEIHEAYDRYPLVQLRRNPRSDRAFAYLRPDVAWSALWDGPEETGAGEESTANVVALGAMNAFNVGASTRVKPVAEVEPITPTQTLSQADGSYRFKGLRAVIAAAGKRGASLRDGFPESRIRKRREYIVEAIGAGDIHVMYYSVPSTAVRHLRYARGFCSEYADEVDGCITHGDRLLLRKLDHKRYWYDAGHLVDKGASQYTRWLADRIAQQMERGTREDAK